MCFYSPAGVALSATLVSSTTDAYFIAPVLFRGDHRLSLGHYLQYDLLSAPSTGGSIQLSLADRIEGDIRIINSNGLTLVARDLNAVGSTTAYHQVRVRVKPKSVFFSSPVIID